MASGFTVRRRDCSDAAVCACVSRACASLTPTVCHVQPRGLTVCVCSGVEGRVVVLRNLQTSFERGLCHEVAQRIRVVKRICVPDGVVRPCMGV
jgi:hypothetical protein